MKLSQILFFLSTIILAYRSRKRWFGWVNALNTEEEVKQYIYRHLIKPKLLKPPYLEWSGILIFTMGFGETRDVNKKVEFGMLSAILGNTLDMCDDVFDQFEQSYEGKVGFLRDMLEVSLTGKSVDYENLPQKSAFVLMKNLHDEVLQKSSAKTREVFGALVDLNVMQLKESDETKLIEIEEETGALIVEAIGLVLELTHNKEFNEVRTVCRDIGAYGQLLDNYFDIEQDISEGVKTYGTQKILHGAESMNNIRKYYQKRASKFLDHEYTFKDECSNYSADLLINLLKFKYRKIKKSITT